jgi:two-component system, chemotaxis family, chemotaxis protein CheY
MNLRDLVILIADPSSYMSMLIHSMLRGFGSNKVLEARNSMGVFHALTAQRIDLLLCDAQLPLHGGLELTHAIRGKKDNEHRTIPILIMTSDSRIDN